MVCVQIKQWRHPARASFLASVYVAVCCTSVHRMDRVAMQNRYRALLINGKTMPPGRKPSSCGALLQHPSHRRRAGPAARRTAIPRQPPVLPLCCRCRLSQLLCRRLALLPSCYTGRLLPPNAALAACLAAAAAARPCTAAAGAGAGGTLAVCLPLHSPRNERFINRNWLPVRVLQAGQVSMLHTQVVREIHGCCKRLHAGCAAGQRSTRRELRQVGWASEWVGGWEAGRAGSREQAWVHRLCDKAQSG